MTTTTKTTTKQTRNARSLGLASRVGAAAAKLNTKAPRAAKPKIVGTEIAKQGVNKAPRKSRAKAATVTLVNPLSQEKPLTVAVAKQTLKAVREVENARAIVQVEAERTEPLTTVEQVGPGHMARRAARMTEAVATAKAADEAAAKMPALATQRIVAGRIASQSTEYRVALALALRIKLGANATTRANAKVLAAGCLKAVAGGVADPSLIALTSAQGPTAKRSGKTKAPRAEGAPSKAQTVVAMLRKGATVEAMAKAIDTGDSKAPAVTVRTFIARIRATNGPGAIFTAVREEGLTVEHNAEGVYKLAKR